MNTENTDADGDGDGQDPEATGGGSGRSLVEVRTASADAGNADGLAFVEDFGFFGGADVELLGARSDADVALLDGYFANGQDSSVRTDADVVSMNLDAFAGFSAENDGAAIEFGREDGIFVVDPEETVFRERE